MKDKPPHIVCVPDSFKGSLSSAGVGQAMAQGVRQVFGEHVALSVVAFADGGEGTLDVLVPAWDGEIRTFDTVDAIGRPVKARVGFCDGAKLAVIEAAEANGLPQVSDVELQAMKASSYGVGMLARHALDAGVEEILLCVGGSASTDAGMGLLSALGAKFLDERADPVTPDGQGLAEVVDIDLSDLHPRATTVRWKIATDVNNPLIGPNGAAQVFAPQKGATPAQVRLLDAGLEHLATVITKYLGSTALAEEQPKHSETHELVQTPGFGAAGGIPVTLSTLLGAQLTSGADLVAQAVNLPEILNQADIIFTGEGTLDEQSLGGKVLSIVQEYAPTDAAVIAIAGATELTAAQCFAGGITAAFSIAPGVCDLDSLMQNASQLISETVAHACSVLSWEMR